MKLVMVTQRLGRKDPILAFIPGWVEQLAARVERLWVVTPRAEKMTWPDNVTVCEVGRDYERGQTVLHALWNFHREMRRLTADGQIDGIFTHMLPKYAILAAPYARRRRIPLVMWYTHRSVSRQLRLAGTLVDRIVTAAPETCPLESAKVRPIGHGIETDIFRPAGRGLERGSQRPTILTVGRVSPVKHLDVLIEAAHILVHRRGLDDLDVVLVGAPPNQNQAWYRDSLVQLTRERGLEEQITFAGSVAHDEIVPLYRRSDLFVSASKTGVDKVVLEAMACETPVVVSDPVFAPALQPYAETLMYRAGDAKALADRLADLLAMPAAERRAIGRHLREVVTASYATGPLMDRLVHTFRELS